MSVGIVLAQAIGRVGCDVFGKPMTNMMIWGVIYNYEILHPAQVYEFIYICSLSIKDFIIMSK